MLRLRKHGPQRIKFPLRDSYVVRLCTFLAFTYYVQFYGTGLAPNDMLNGVRKPIKFGFNEWERCDFPFTRDISVMRIGWPCLITGIHSFDWWMDYSYRSISWFHCLGSIDSITERVDWWRNCTKKFVDCVAENEFLDRI